MPYYVCRAAFLKLKKKGIEFEFWFFDPQALTLSRPTQQEMHAISDDEVRSRLKYTAKVLEDRYNLAIATNNHGEMEAVLKAALELIWQFAKAYGRARGNRNRQSQVMLEGEKFNRAVNEAFEEATGLRTHFLRLTREEIKELRFAPLPEGLEEARIEVVP